AGRATSLADHHVGRLDDRPGIIAHMEIKISNGLVGNRGRDDDATANIDADMGRRGALRYVDNPSLELIACAEFHGAFLYCIKTVLRCLFFDAAKGRNSRLEDHA